MMSEFEKFTEENLKRLTMLSIDVVDKVTAELEKAAESARQVLAALPLRRRIVAAAIQLDGFIASVPKPLRHYDIIYRLADTGFPTPIGGVQGFLTNHGYFVDRKTAMRIAIDAGQLKWRDGQQGPDGDLFSEDLW